MYPIAKYGYLTGTITNIFQGSESGIKAADPGYYLVEAKLDGKTLYDAQGNTRRILKSGMTCEAQMITESKRILTYVLEKIDLWIK